jgi:integrase/recombinase XerD
VRMTAAIDEFVADMKADGRFNSAETERSYRTTLSAHAEDVSNRDPAKVGRDDVTATLRRWAHPNTRSVSRSHLVSFYDWAMQTGHRKDNPARQTRAPRKRKPTVYRLTRDEVRAFRNAAHPGREKRIADLGLLAGLRSRELLGLQGRHLRRPGWLWVSPDIGKGGRERWVPVLPELEQTVADCAQVADQEFVLPRRRHEIRPEGRVDVWDPGLPMAYETLHRTVGNVGRRAGIRARVTPHMMRHAYGDHIARFAGLKVAQFVLGHADVGTTEAYTGPPTLDEVAVALGGFGFGELRLPPGDRAANPLVAAAARFPGESATGGPERDLGRILVWLRANPVFQDAVQRMATHA